MTNKISRSLIFSIIAFFLLSNQSTFGQFDRIERGRVKDMLKTVVKQIEKNYYDPNFHGIDLEAREKLANEKLDNATSLGQAFGIIAQLFLDFNDSHLVFYPPDRAMTIEYGWRIIMVGDKCFVSAVKPESDAHKKGLKTGDQVLSVNGFRPTRNEMWKMEYFYYALSPQSKVNLAVQSPNEEPRELIVETKVKNLKRVTDLTSDMGINEYLRDMNSDNESSYHRFFSIGGVAIWRMPSFSFDPMQVRQIMKERISGNRGLIIDLRDNGGGYIDTLKEIAGFLFEKDIKIADIKRREIKENEEMIGKSKGENTFGGKIVVLIDSKSGSSSELLARLMQIEKRGTVIGDVSAGAVMQSRFYSNKLGVNKQVFYGASITNADLIMTDGKSLEHVGVTPDELILKSADDLANERDP
ncbi:MAG: PDZ domain-containing protein, partial [Acidobacteria bacterium]|nr:PDZ domain-containing protein [Acidobacteriota bacterium]